MSFTIEVPKDYTPSSGNNNGPIEPMPVGNYTATVFEIKAEEVKSGPNAGKPRWNVQFRVSDGTYENRRVFSYIPMYVAGDFWKFESFFSALGYEVKGKFSVPEINEVLGKPLSVRVKVREAEGDYPAANEVAGFNRVKSAADNLKAMGATESVWVK
jgi:hypothetical protein